MEERTGERTWNGLGKIERRLSLIHILSNMEIYQCDADGSNGHWVKVDMVRTVTGIEKYKGQDGYIALGEMCIRDRFYSAIFKNLSIN